jgi:hypothetical protein
MKSQAVAQDTEQLFRFMSIVASLLAQGDTFFLFRDVRSRLTDAHDCMVQFSK